MCVDHTRHDRARHALPSHRGSHVHRGQHVHRDRHAQSGHHDHELRTSHFL